MSQRYPNLSFLVGIHCLLWIVILYLTKTDLDSYGDMIENYAWGQVFDWGSFKHPPFFSWVTGVWFRIFPENRLAYYLLSYLNVAIGLWGIVNLAKSFQKKEQDSQKELLWWTLAFTMLAFPYANLAVKFNADTVLLSLWPWTTSFFISSLYGQTRRPYLTAVGLGVMAAISLLGKYFSGILLCTLFIISLSQKDYRRWYLTPYPYCAFLVMGILLIPHGVWLFQMDFPFMHYLEGKMWTKNSLSQLVSFLCAGIYYFIFSWIIWGYFFFNKKNKKYSEISSYSRQTINTLFLLSVLPTMLTFLCGAFNLIKLTVHWAIPVGFAIPILMVVLLRTMVTKENTQRFWHMILCLWGGVVFLSGVFLITIMKTGKERYFLARQEMAFAIQEEWKKQFPHQRLFEWVSGTWSEPAALSFYLPTHPRALPSVPDDPISLVNPVPGWETKNGVLLCHASPLGKESLGKYQKCVSDTEEWLTKHGQSNRKTEIFYKSKDWRAFNAPTRKVTVYWYIPK